MLMKQSVALSDYFFSPREIMNLLLATIFKIVLDTHPSRVI